MKLDAIIQARLNSKRLPKKIVLNYGGKTVLETLISQLKKCKSIGRIIIAIPSGHQHIELYGYLNTKFENDKRVLIGFGSEEDVMGRMIEVCDLYEVRDFFRICADSPLIVPWVFDYCKDIYTNKVPNYLKTTGLPLGQNIEIVDVNTLKEIHSKATKEEKEHVTLYFDNHPKEYFVKTINLGKMCIDTPEDYKFFKEIEKYAI